MVMMVMVMIWKSKPPQRWWLHRRGLHWSHRTVEETELPGCLRWGKHKSSFLGNWPCWWWRAWGRSCWSGGWRWKCCQRPCCPPGLPPSPSTQSWRQSLVRGERGGTSWPPPPCPWRAGRWGSGAWRRGRGPSRQAPRCRGRRVFANWQTCRPFLMITDVKKRNDHRPILRRRRQRMPSAAGGLPGLPSSQAQLSQRCKPGQSCKTQQLSSGCWFEVVFRCFVPDWKISSKIQKLICANF